MTSTQAIIIVTEMQSRTENAWSEIDDTIKHAVLHFSVAKTISIHA